MENSPKTPEDNSFEQDYQRRVALEANQLHGKKLSPESIGQVLMSADVGAETRAALRQEILENEKDFERDPRLRHQSASRDPMSQSLKLKDLLSKAGIVETGNTADQPAVTNRRPSPEYLEHHLKQQAQHRRLLDLTFIVIILALLIVVILLVMRRG